MTGPGSSPRRTAAFILYNIIFTLVLILVIEGSASVYYVCRDAFALRPNAERLHTEYDRELGWVNLPNIYLPNMYGPGKSLRTNSQRFRNDADFPPSVPAGKTRIICSGDSFTLGFGVDNDHTWPQLLASRHQNVESVNMGQGGYGADQAYLWYKRDGARLDHHIQVFAIITPDLYRMQNASFNGYGKPMLAFENDHLVTKNVPVPKSVEVWSPNLARVQSALSNLSITHLLRRMLRLDDAAAASETRKERNKEISAVLPYMLDDLIATNRAKNSVLALAYLPTRAEANPGDAGGAWRKFLAEYAAQRELPYFDLTDDLRRLPPEELDKLFISKGAVDFPGAAGHYTEAGNAFVADLIYQRLIANPETARKLHIQPHNAVGYGDK